MRVSHKRSDLRGDLAELLKSVETSFENIDKASGRVRLGNTRTFQCLEQEVPVRAEVYFPSTGGSLYGTSSKITRRKNDAVVFTGNGESSIRITEKAGFITFVARKSKH